MWKASSTTINSNEQAHKNTNHDGVGLMPLGGIVRGFHYDMHRSAPFWRILHHFWRPSIFGATRQVTLEGKHMAWKMVSFSTFSTCYSTLLHVTVGFHFLLRNPELSKPGCYIEMLAECMSKHNKDMVVSFCIFSLFGCATRGAQASQHVRTH